MTQYVRQSSFLFNSTILFVLLFDNYSETAALLMIWVKETKESNSTYEFAQRQSVVLDDYGINFVINTGIWLVSVDCFKHIDNDEICDRKCDTRRPVVRNSCRHRIGGNSDKNNMPHSN